MFLTPEMLDAKGMCDYELDIFTGIYPNGADTDLSMGIALDVAGVDIYWIIRKFLDPIDIQPAIDAIKQAYAAYLLAKDTAVSAYDIVVDIPLLGAPTVLKDALTVAEDAIVPAEAAAFAAAFAGAP